MAGVDEFGDVKDASAGATAPPAGHLHVAAAFSDALVLSFTRGSAWHLILVLHMCNSIADAVEGAMSGAGDMIPGEDMDAGWP